jgi:hypothetical protein
MKMHNDCFRIFPSSCDANKFYIGNQDFEMGIFLEGKQQLTWSGKAFAFPTIAIDSLNKIHIVFVDGKLDICYTKGIKLN